MSIKKIIQFAQEVYRSLPGVTAISEETLKSLIAKQGKIDFESNKATYDKNATQVLDFLILQLPDVVFAEINANFHKFNGTALTLSAIMGRLKHSIDPAMHYLDDGVAFLPHITSQTLYDRMLWVEWLLIRIHEAAAHLSFAIRMPLNKFFLDARLHVITQRLNDYAKLHGIMRISVDQLENHWQQNKNDEKNLQLEEKISLDKNIVAENTEDEIFEDAKSLPDTYEYDWALRLAKKNSLSDYFSKHFAFTYFQFKNSDSSSVTLAKLNVLHEIEFYLHENKTLGSHSKKRAAELKEKVESCNNIQDLTTVVSDFIRTGKTQSDHLFQKSHLFEEHSLRKILINAFCPENSKVKLNISTHGLNHIVDSLDLFANTKKKNLQPFRFV